jgi:cell division protein FtsL
MTTIAEPARAGRVRAPTRSRPRLLSGGVLWIVLFASLLTGVVAINVAVLRLNLRLDRTDAERTQLTADIARVRSDLSSAVATARIERKARADLRLVPANPDTTVYVRLPAK